MRTPRNTVATILTAACVSALFLVLGGPGGAWLLARDTRRRVNSFADDLEALDRRIARRDGEKGAQTRRENKSQEAEEIDRILANPRNGKRRSAIDGDDAEVDPLVRATVESWLHQGRRE